MTEQTETPKPMAPWKRKLFEQTQALEETPEFQKGVISGYHYGAMELFKAANVPGYVVQTEEQVRKWAEGLVAGYVVRLQVEQKNVQQVQEGATSEH